MSVKCAHFMVYFTGWKWYSTFTIRTNVLWFKKDHMVCFLPSNHWFPLLFFKLISKDFFGLCNSIFFCNWYPSYTLVLNGLNHSCGPLHIKHSLHDWITVKVVHIFLSQGQYMNEKHQNYEILYNMITLDKYCNCFSIFFLQYFK